MSRMIQIRNVPDDVHRKLKVRAAQEGVTLSELLAREARRLAEQPSMAEMLERIAARPAVKLKTPSSRTIRELRDSR
jgi:plasmid stability protein